MASAALIPAAALGQEVPVEDVTAPIPSEERRIDIFNYRIDGNTVLSRGEVEDAVLPYLGPQRPQSDVELARAALEKVYRDKGYATVAVETPEQDVTGDGVVLLKVTELTVGRLRVTNARYFSPDDIKARAPSLAEGRVPNYAQVEREIQALNKSADRSVTPTLRAGETPGTVDVDLEVEDRLPVSATLELNDRTSARTERLRLSASATYSNLWQLGHSLSIQGQIAPQDPSQSWIVSASYVMPFQNSPFALVVYGVHSDSDVAAAGDITVLGSGNIVGARGIYTFGGGDWRHSLTAGIDYKDFREDLVLGPEFGRTPIDYIPLSLQYGLNRNTERSDLSFSAGLTFGLRGLDADEAEFRLKRFNASASWASLKLDASWLHRLPNDMRFQIRTAAQLANRPLISNEEFVIGGLDSVRGYYESQELGDRGISGQLDLFSPSLTPLIGGPVGEWRFYAFGDVGYVGIFDPLPDLSGFRKDEEWLASAGVGTRLTLFKVFNLDALLAAPLRFPDDTLTDIDGKFRAQFRAWVAF